MLKNNIKEYSERILNTNKYFVLERNNPYGHIREFYKLKKSIQIDAHRVISPIAIKLANIEDTYSVTDINGNTYIFDIFEDGNYRISEIIRFKNYVEEVTDEEYIEKNS